MFLGILDVFKQSFQFVFDSLNKIVVIGNSTMFDFIIVFFVASAFITLFFNIFGASVSTAGSSAVNYVHEQKLLEEQSKRDAQRLAERQHRESYAFYKERRARSEAYSSRYVREKKGR